MKTTIYLFFTAYVLCSCGEVNCNDVKKAYYSEEYYLVAQEIDIDQTWIKIKGTVPVKEYESNIMVHNNWIDNSNDVEVGDTIIKKKGELPLYIHKKDTIIVHDWYCDGKPYK
ncbi:hypothetical protein CQ046_12975 [Chryseobacterium sp. MYb7]|uniref:hypothetical protein n=1 Tax=Chryseobacterium sp. MYb7 TaxID=1827290 RepID=UPI000CFE8E96|nr:hypothetical protein [Chryseobacterium sp. MYb7]PRB02464.1 hypothetical protein CQ046_12975 [Chryseobacterium sp. MYb7]